MSIGECEEKMWVEGRLDTDSSLLPRFFISLYTPHISPCSLYFLYLLTIPHKHTPTPVMPFMYISCVPHYYYISGILFHISFSSVFLPVSPVLCQRKNFLFRFSSRIYPARNFLRTAKISLQNYRKQLTKSPACGKIVSYLHILSNVTIRRKRVDKQGIMW